jgi:hypothetical protein
MNTEIQKIIRISGILTFMLSLYTDPKNLMP